MNDWLLGLLFWAMIGVVLLALWTAWPAVERPTPVEPHPAVIQR